MSEHKGLHEGCNACHRQEHSLYWELPPRKKWEKFLEERRCRTCRHIHPGGTECGTSNPVDNEHGWLSPEGVFYACHYTGHYTLAEYIITKVHKNKNFRGYADDRMFDLGYLKFQNGNVYLGYGESTKTKTITQKQFDFLCEYEVRRDSKMIVNGVRSIQDLQIK